LAGVSSPIGGGATPVFEGALRSGVDEPGLPQCKAHPYEGLLLLDALALFRDGEQEKGMRCIRKLQESSRLHELVDLICPGFAVQHDRRAQRIRRAILNPDNGQGIFAAREDLAGLSALQPAAPIERPVASTLTPRQRVVLALVRDGLTNRQIAARMLVSENTVKWHLKALSRLLGAGNRCSIIRIAEQRRLLAPRTLPAAAGEGESRLAAG
jgi:DNA-binding CsgD family transcriptional regulator